MKNKPKQSRAQSELKFIIKNSMLFIITINNQNSVSLISCFSHIVECLIEQSNKADQF